MTAGLISIIEDNDLSRRIQEILAQKETVRNPYELKLLTTSHYRHFPQMLLPAAISGLINISDYCTPASWYADRHIHRIQAQNCLVDLTPSEQKKCYIDCRPAGIRIHFRRNDRINNDLIASRPDEIIALIPLVITSMFINVCSTNPEAILMAFALHKAGKKVSFIKNEEHWIDEQLDEEIQQAISTCIKRQGISLEGDHNIYPQISVSGDSNEFHLYGDQILCDEVMIRLNALSISRPSKKISIGDTPCHYLLPDSNATEMDILSMSSSIDGILRKVWIQNDRVQGFFFLGDISGSDVTHSLIKNRTDISAIRHQLLFA